LSDTTSIRRAKVRMRLLGSTGFVRRSFIPASRHICRAASMACAVIAMSLNDDWQPLDDPDL